MWWAGVVLSGLLVTAGCAASDRPDEATIANLFKQWDAALATGDAAKVADRYAPEAVLVPTRSNQVRTGRAGIVDYFQHFLADKPRGTVTKSVIRVLDDDTAVDSGTYRFTFTQDGQPKQIDARYTYVYELRDGKWLIVNHHSSAMPE